MKNAGGVDNHHLANLKKTNSVIQNFNQAKQCKMRFFRRVTLLESVTLIVGVTFIFVVDLGDAFAMGLHQKSSGVTLMDSVTVWTIFSTGRLGVALIDCVTVMIRCVAK